MPRQWSEEVHTITYATNTVICQDLKHFIITLHTPPYDSAKVPKEGHDRQQIIGVADVIHDLLDDELRIATNIFPIKASYSRPIYKQLGRQLPKTVKRDIITLRNRSILLW